VRSQTVSFQLWFSSYTVTITVTNFFHYSVAVVINVNFYNIFSVTVTVSRFFCYYYSYVLSYLKFNTKSRFIQVGSDSFPISSERNILSVIIICRVK